MSLTPPAPRKPVHHRQINCTGYHREDGLWDIEGHLIDTKTYSFANKFRGEITPGQPLHEMRVRLTLNDEFVILKAEAVTLYSPYPECSGLPDRLHLLHGQKIAAGWNKTVRKALGGINGCTHINEILGRLATAAYQTMMPRLNKANRNDESNSRQTKRPYTLNTCHAYDEKGTMVSREWPQFYTGKSE